MEDCEKLIKEAFPQINEDIYSYVESVLRVSGSDFESPDEIHEALGEVLLEVSDSGTTEEDVKDICGQIWKILGFSTTNSSSIRVLDSPLQMSSFKNSKIEETNSLWLSNSRDDGLRNVDSKKLLKAEEKIKQKQEKRTEFPKIVPNLSLNECQASAAQVLSKKETKMDSKGQGGRVQDIKIENFDIAFGEKVLIQGASLTLSFGRRYGLTGRNGLGKTTLLKMIAHGNLKIPSGISVLHVEQEVVGDETLALDSVLEADVIRTNLLANEKRLLNSQSGDAATELAEIYAQLQMIEADKAPARASVILAGLGFSPEAQKRATKTFSGGWRMRLALARALFAKPDLLLLDEPTNMLDLVAIIWLENYLETWPSTLLVVSHDRHFLDAVATDMVHLNAQELVHYRGNYSNFMKTRGEREKNQQREWDAQVQLRAHTQAFIDKFRYNAKRASLVQSKIKFLERLPVLRPVEKESEVIIRFPQVPPLPPPVLQLDDVTFGYTKENPILQKVCLSASSESRICIVGENGAGKTTLLKLVLGDLSPLSGHVATHRGIRFGYFTQHHVDQLEMNTTPVGLLQTKFPGSSVEEYRRQLGRFGISGELAVQSVSSLSGGQKSRVAFTVMSASSPNFLILDEPTNHLDVETIEALSTAINNFGGGVILVSHDEGLIRSVCKELWICGKGTVRRIEGGFDEYRSIVQQQLESALN